MKLKAVAGIASEAFSVVALTLAAGLYMSAASDGHHVIEGRMVDDAGAPLAGKILALMPEGSDAGIATAITELDGSFRFADVKSGCYTVDSHANEVCVTGLNSVMTYFGYPYKMRDLQP
jgi:hypothetical protein